MTSWALSMEETPMDAPPPPARISSSRIEACTARPWIVQAMYSRPGEAGMMPKR